ncbi:MAG: xanthine dehydrogenase family protein molybdopterin-binding subunit [Deltaproteobacteria bacterium]|nr:xanthine dehydrogenase family protein molybdopterin-binding subunit [Deltaproteobacteria bacterium]
MSDYYAVGKSVSRVDATAKVTGEAVYTADVMLPGMLYGMAKRSPYAHARIVRIDSRKAEALPGVRAVITAENVPGVLLGLKLQDVPILARNEARFAGEKVAAVAAVDEETAREAINLIEVEYEELPAITDVEEAMKDGAPLVHDNLHTYAGLPAPVKHTNIFFHETFSKGDTAQGFAQADLVFEQTFTTPIVHQGYMEPHAALVDIAPDGGVTVWSSVKVPFRVRAIMAEIIGLPITRVRVIPGFVGGDFGGKGMVLDEPLCYYLARKSGRPVKMVMSRQEEFLAASPRHASIIRLKAGVSKSAELVAWEANAVFDSGAYAGYKPGVGLGGTKKLAGAYRVPHVRIDGYYVYTHTVPCGHCRAPGDPQASFAVESFIDMIASRLKLDPFCFRWLNALEEGDLSPTGEPWKAINLKETMTAAVNASGWGKPKPRKHYGIGIACAERPTGTGESSAVVIVSGDGSVNLITGSSDPGTGSRTILCQIVAEALKVPMDRITINLVDTDSAPYDQGAGGGRTTFVAGLSAYRAALEVRKQLVASAAKLLKCPQEQAQDLIEARDGFLFVKSDPNKKISYSQAVRAAGKSQLIGEETFSCKEMDDTCFATHIAEVQVDAERGVVEVLRITAAHDIGFAINPAAAEGQIEGGIVQGVGFALLEEMQRAEGKVANPTLTDYKLCTSLDAPEIVTLLVEGAPGAGPFHAKAIGEIPTCPIAPAVANAIFDAVGVRITELPITGEKIVKALKESGASRPVPVAVGKER